MTPGYQLDNDKALRERHHTITTIHNKPVYDHTHGDGIVVKDKRMAIDILLVRRDLRASNMTLRWVDTRHMMADPLTKTSADPSFLRFVFKEGQYIVIKEDKSLLWKAKEKELKAVKACHPVTCGSFQNVMIVI